MPQYDMDSGITNTITNTTTSFSISEVWIIVSVILAIIGGIILFKTYFNKDKSYTGLKKVLYDFANFKITIIEPLFKVLYLIITIFITLCSFSYLTVNFFKFISILVFGNMIARLVFEVSLLTLKLFKDVSELNSKISPIKKSEKVIKKTSKKEIEEIN